MEKTEKFRVRKYSKKTGTNMYAAPMRKQKKKKNFSNFRIKMLLRNI